jgi:hypothetical protein
MVGVRSSLIRQSWYAQPRRRTSRTVDLSEVHDHQVDIPYNYLHEHEVAVAYIPSYERYIANVSCTSMQNDSADRDYQNWVLEDLEGLYVENFLLQNKYEDVVEKLKPLMGQDNLHRLKQGLQVVIIDGDDSLTFWSG